MSDKRATAYILPISKIFVLPEIGTTWEEGGRLLSDIKKHVQLAIWVMMNTVPQFR